MPRAVKRIPYTRDPIAWDYIRRQLKERGVVCEFMDCESPATDAHLGDREVAWLCSEHRERCATYPAVARELEHDMWDRFSREFNFIRKVHDSFGGLLVEIEETKIAQQKLDKNQVKLFTNLLKGARKAGSKPGTPDDDLARARGAQSPPPTPIQVVFREASGLLLPTLIQNPPALTQGEQNE